MAMSLRAKQAVIWFIVAIFLLVVFLPALTDRI